MPCSPGLARLDRLTHQLKAKGDVASPYPDVCVLPFDQVELPSSSTGRKQRLAVADVADRLSVVAAGLATGQVNEHSPLSDGVEVGSPRTNRIGTLRTRKTTGITRIISRRRTGGRGSSVIVLTLESDSEEVVTIAQTRS